MDIRNYNITETNPSGSSKNGNYRDIMNLLETLKKSDNLINDECEGLAARMEPKNEWAFTKKLKAWQGLVLNLDVLYDMYKKN